MIEFKGFDKIARLSRGCTITEKIDGTNAQICITEDGEFLVGSRTRWITPEDDNFGFASWAHEHKAELMQLGPGQHFGEWWGCGIQRTYGLQENRFSLFNTSRWCADVQMPPACCGVVPVLYSGIFTSTAVDDALALLRERGSVAAPGFMRPEGVVVYQSAGRCYFKKTLEKDDEPKSRNDKSNPSLQGAGHLVDRTLKGVVRMRSTCECGRDLIYKSSLRHGKCRVCRTDNQWTCQ